MSGSGPTVSPSQEAMLEQQQPLWGLSSVLLFLPVAPSEGQTGAVHKQSFPPHRASLPVRGQLGLQAASLVKRPVHHSWGAKHSVHRQWQHCPEALAAGGLREPASRAVPAAPARQADVIPKHLRRWQLQGEAAASSGSFRLPQTIGLFLSPISYHFWRPAQSKAGRAVQQQQQQARTERGPRGLQGGPAQQGGRQGDCTIEKRREAQGGETVGWSPEVTPDMAQLAHRLCAESPRQLQPVAAWGWSTQTAPERVWNLGGGVISSLFPRGSLWRWAEHHPLQPHKRSLRRNPYRHPQPRLTQACRPIILGLTE